LHDLIVLDPAAMPGTITHAEIERVGAYLQNEKAQSTQECYEADFKHFSAWCSARSFEALPALPGTIAVYLSTLADAGKKASTIARRMAAIGHRHKLAGVDPLPTASEGVRATMRGIRRTIGAAVVPKAPTTHDLIGAMLKLCPDTMIGKRDKALPAFGFASAMRRSELVALNVDDITETPDGLRVLIRRSKGDQEGVGQTIAIMRGSFLRPVEALQDWIAAAGITEGQIFRAVLLGGRVQQSWTAECLCRRVKYYAEMMGLDPKTIGAHSMRSGVITSAADNGASIWKIVELSRHKSIGTVQSYVRKVDLFREHAAAKFV
jgi:site-specific recombinase XerD